MKIWTINKKEDFISLFIIFILILWMSINPTNKADRKLNHLLFIHKYTSSHVGKRWNEHCRNLTHLACGNYEMGHSWDLNPKPCRFLNSDTMWMTISSKSLSWYGDWEMYHLKFIYYHIFFLLLICNIC